MNCYLQDNHGNKSSKRLWGSILLSFGIIFAMILFCFSLTKGASDPQTASNIINIFLYSGGGLLGIGTFEKILGKEENKK
jgi:hypothetical protein